MPTSIVKAIEIDYGKCDGCGICIDFCPVGVFAVEKGMPAVHRLSACYACDTCTDLCPKSAIEIICESTSGSNFGAGRNGIKYR
jgi:NAD-dependent dihydropyrimidine dehydrogenase PreA subunit